MMTTKNEREKTHSCVLAECHDALAEWHEGQEDGVHHHEHHDYEDEVWFEEHEDAKPAAHDDVLAATTPKAMPKKKKQGSMTVVKTRTNPYANDHEGLLSQVMALM